MIILFPFILIVVIVIALKGAFEIFTISSLRCEQSPKRTLKWPGPNRVQITCNTSSAYHVQHVVCHVTRRDSLYKETCCTSTDNCQLSFINMHVACLYIPITSGVHSDLRRSGKVHSFINIMNLFVPRARVILSLTS